LLEKALLQHNACRIWGAKATEQGSEGNKGLGALVETLGEVAPQCFRLIEGTSALVAAG
jgi:hypothetical protein